MCARIKINNKITKKSTKTQNRVGGEQRLVFGFSQTTRALQASLSSKA